MSTVQLIQFSREDEGDHDSVEHRCMQGDLVYTRDGGGPPPIPVEYFRSGVAFIREPPMREFYSITPLGFPPYELPYNYFRDIQKTVMKRWHKAHVYGTPRSRNNNKKVDLDRRKPIHKPCIKTTFTRIRIK